MCLSEEKNCIQRKWNNKEFLHCCKKVISSFKELYKTPAKHTKKLFCFVQPSYYNQHIKKYECYFRVACY